MTFAKQIEQSLMLGVLNLSIMNELLNEGILINADGDKIKKDLHDESSALDLRLSEIGWELTSTVKPKINDTIDSMMNIYSSSKLENLRDGELLKRGKVYLIKLQESLNLLDKFKLYAQASGKSSIGRLDVLTRLIVDGSPIYDEIDNGYHGPLYIEIIPLSFPIIVKKNDSLNQLRLFRGNPSISKLNQHELEQMSKSTPIILDENGETKIEDIEKLKIDLTPTNCGPHQYGSAYEALENDDLEPIVIGSKDKYEPEKYWKIIHAKNDSIKMEKDHFYIIRSKERFYLPKDIAVRCIAYTENLGETRIHYAGFAHPWFARGDAKKSKKGAPLIFEVRCHSFPVEARDGEDFARIEFYQMAAPTEVHTPYDSQELKLSKYFNEWK